MFPYPSGAGLHVGHPLGYIATDVVGRYKRMTGANVLHALGYDAFGLPAEIFAVETGRHPRETTIENMATMKRQLRRLGLAHDRRRSFATIDPEFVRWTQWIFLQLFNSWYDTEQKKARPDRRADREAGHRRPRGHRHLPAGLHQRRPGQLVPRARHGALQRGGHRRRAQRARQLPGVQAQPAPVADAHHRLRRPADRRPRARRLARAGHDHAAQLDRPLARRRGLVPGGRFRRGHRRLHDASGHPVRRHLHGASRRRPSSSTRSSPTPGPTDVDARWTGGAATPAEAVAAYRAQAAAKTDIERQENRDKTGVFTGAYAVNPVNGEQIPVFIADYVLAGYGTGAIMAVPGQDDRDWEFAETFGLPIVRTVQPPEGHEGPFLGEGPAINSANDSVSLDGLGVDDAKAHDHRLARASRAAAAAPRRTGCATGCSAASATGASRSRSSTTRAATRSPCPTRCCPSTCRRLPTSRRARSSPTTPPASRSRRWGGPPSGSNVELDLGDGPKPYRRETNTMPNWAGSSLVRAALHRPEQHRGHDRPRERALLARSARAGRHRRGRPLHRRRRARRAAPALRPLLAQGAVRPRARLQRGAVPPPAQPGLHPGPGLHRRAGSYVPAEDQHRLEVRDAECLPCARCGTSSPSRSRSRRRGCSRAFSFRRGSSRAGGRARPR